MYRSDGVLLACAVNWAPDYMALGRSDDGDCREPIFEFRDIAGPLECAPGTAQFDTCDGGGCGCQLAFASALFVVPRRRRVTRRP